LLATERPWSRTNLRGPIAQAILDSAALRQAETAFAARLTVASPAHDVRIDVMIDIWQRSGDAF
jgi:hypothetical protein